MIDQSLSKSNFMLSNKGYCGVRQANSVSRTAGGMGGMSHHVRPYIFLVPVLQITPFKLTRWGGIPALGRGGGTPQPAGDLIQNR